MGNGNDRDKMSKRASQQHISFHKVDTSTAVYEIYSQQEAVL